MASNRATVDMTTGVVVSISPTFGLGSSEPGLLIEAAGAKLVQLDPSTSHDDSTWLGHLSQAEVLIVGSQAIGSDIMAKAPALHTVAKHGAGVDNIDMSAAAHLGIVVTNAPGTNAEAVAELTIGLIFSCARGIVQADRAVRRGEWATRLGRSVAGATLGIVGLGTIGRLVAERATALGMNVVAHDVEAPHEGTQGWRTVELDELLSASDFVSLHVPLTPRTLGLIDESALESMKPDAFLINTSRGGVVDEVALVLALRRGWIAGAALDVMLSEPGSPDNALVQFPERTIITPHMAGYTRDAILLTSLSTAQSVCEALQGSWPRNAVNHPREWRGARK